MLDRFLNSLLIVFRISYPSLELVALAISALAKNQVNAGLYAIHPRSF